MLWDYFSETVIMWEVDVGFVFYDWSIRTDFEEMRDRKWGIPFNYIRVL